MDARSSQLKYGTRNHQATDQVKGAGVRRSLILGSWILDLGSLLPAFVLFLTVGCSGQQIYDRAAVDSIPALIHEDLTVSGTIRVKGEVRVLAGAVLTVQPGTRFLFQPFDPDNDGVNDARLVIEGLLIARGDPDAPIYFSSAAPEPQPGDWLELRMDHSEGSVLEYCVLEHSRYGLHVHFSSGYVMNSVFRDNLDGTRFGTSRFEFVFNLVQGNEGRGINLRDSQINIGDNRIENNGHGIFLFEKAGRSIVGFNLFKKNERSDIQFGDFYEGNAPSMTGNRREDGSPVAVAGFEGEMDPGRTLEGFPWSQWEPGPIAFGHRTREIWRKHAGSLIDSAPVFEEPYHGKIAVPTRDEGLYILETGTGLEIAHIPVSDVTAATPEIMDGVLYFPSRDSEVLAIDMNSGEILDRVSWEAPAADDQRQASPMASGEGRIYLGFWNGDFRELDPVTMRWTWSVSLDGPVRGAAALAQDFMWVGTDSGSLFKVSYEGEILTRVDLDGAVRVAPVLIGEDGLIVVTSGGILYRLDDDRILWRRKLPGRGTLGAPVVSRHHFEQIWVGDESGAVSSFTGDGALMWRLEMGSAVNVLSEPVSGVLLAGTDNNGVGIMTATGRFLGNLDSEGAVHGLAVRDLKDEVMVVYGARDGVVRACVLTLSRQPWEPPAR